MKRTTRIVTGSLVTLALTVSMTTVTSAIANAAALDPDQGASWTAYEPKPVRIAYPGMFFEFTGDWTNFRAIPDGLTGQARTDFLRTAQADGKFTSNNNCTMGPVGTDSAGRKIGITSGHCHQPAFSVEYGPVLHPGPPRGSEVPDQDLAKYPVYDKNAVQWSKQNSQVPPPSPIGWIRWVDDDVCEPGENDMANEPCDTALANRRTDMYSTTDYMVIEFAPDVQLSSQVYDRKGSPVMSTASGSKPFKVNSIYTDSNGAPAVPGSLFNSVEIYGARTDRDPVAGSFVYSTPTEGVVAGVGNGMIRAAAGFAPGDSGGPVVLKGTGKWVGISTKTHGLPVPWISTSAKNILTDLNRPGRPGDVGRGFTPINN